MNVSTEPQTEKKAFNGYMTNYYRFRYGAMAAMNKLANTTVVDESPYGVMVSFYETAIVRINYTTGLCILNTGGHFTKTTKSRMNKVLEGIGCEYRVHQHDFSWYVSNGETGFKFHNNEVEFHVTK